MADPTLKDLHELLLALTGKVDALLDSKTPVEVDLLHPANIGNPDHEKEKKRLQAIMKDPQHKERASAEKRLREFGFA